MLLPAPFSPTMAWTSPGATSKETSCSARTPANDLLTPLISSIPPPRSPRPCCALSEKSISLIARQARAVVNGEWAVDCCFPSNRRGNRLLQDAVPRDPRAVEDIHSAIGNETGRHRRRTIRPRPGGVEREEDAMSRWTRRDLLRATAASAAVAVPAVGLRGSAASAAVPLRRRGRRRRAGGVRRRRSRPPPVR